MRTAVIYARFSCSKQREESIEGQLRVCRKWCDDNGYEVVAEYCDQARSGLTDDRPQFQLMISRAGESDIVLVYAMDRFSRDIYDAPMYKKRIRDAGARVVSATEAMPDGPEAMLFENLYEAMAAMESARTSRRTKRDMRGNALKCLHNGVRVFGYKVGPDGRYEIDEEQAPFVREAFERRATGEPTNSIAADFARRGVRTYTGKPCGHTMIYNMVRNEKYKGIYIWDDVRIEGGMPRIVSDDLFDRARNAPTSKSRVKEDWGDYALTGRALCGTCGKNLRGTSGRNNQGRKYEYYQCSCRAKRIRREQLEAVCVNGIRELLADEETARMIARMVADSIDTSEEDAKLSVARSALRDANRGLENLLRAVESGVIVPGTMERVAELEAQRDAAKREIETTVADAPDVDDFAEFLMHGSTLDDRTLMDAFVYQVWLFEDEIVVTLNYDEEKGKPARFFAERVSTEFDLLPMKGRLLTAIAYKHGKLYIKLPRAA